MSVADNRQSTGRAWRKFVFPVLMPGIKITNADRHKEGTEKSRGYSVGIHDGLIVQWRDYIHSTHVTSRGFFRFGEPGIKPHPAGLSRASAASHMRATAALLRQATIP
jgi:hypothetical protein